MQEVAETRNSYIITTLLNVNFTINARTSCQTSVHQNLSKSKEAHLTIYSHLELLRDTEQRCLDSPKLAKLTTSSHLIITSTVP